MSEWIKCSDSLPSKYGYYLTYNINDKYVSKFVGMEVLRYYPKQKKFWWFDKGFTEITHWLHLPKPPE